MAPIRNCERCGADIPSGGGVEGMCPRCLMEIARGWSLGGAPAGAPPPPEEVAALFPALEFGELVGRGGMGAVYRARHKELDRPVAVKILPPEVYSDPSFAERFEREARTLARLDHPNVVRVYDAGRAGGRYYLLMELVDGVDLRQMIRAGRVEPREALAIVGQVCDALQYAHDQGVVHRDVKPENILVDRQGRVKIADFGLAKLLGREPGAYTLTRTDQAMGTLHYMAPEQMERPLSVDHRADIFSLGVVFYELLTGELPLGRFQPPSAKVAVDVRLDEVVLRTLEKEPERRYQHASDVKTAVGVASRPIPPAIPDDGGGRRRVQAGRAEPAAPAAPAGHRRRFSGPWPWVAGCGCLSFVALFLLLPATIVGTSYQRAEVAQAEAARAHADALAERQREFARAAVADAAVAELPPPLEWRDGAPALAPEFARRFGLDEGAVYGVEGVLAATRERYLELEREHVVLVAEAPDYARVDLMAFPDERQALEDAMWRALDDALADIPVEALRRGGLIEELLPFGREPIELRLDHTDGQSFEVTVLRPESGSQSAVRTATLPRKYARFWRE